MFGISEVIAFFVGAVVGRYFEEIIAIIFRIKKDLQRAQRDFKKQIPQ